MPRKAFYAGGHGAISLQFSGKLFTQRQRTNMLRCCNGAAASARCYSGGFEQTVNFNENYSKDVQHLSAESGIFAACERGSGNA